MISVLAQPPLTVILIISGQLVGPIFQSLADELTDIKFVKVDTDKHEDKGMCILYCEVEAQRMLHRSGQK